MNSFQKVGLTLGTAALALGGVAGISSLAQAADPTTNPVPAATAGAQDGQGNRWGMQGERGHGSRQGGMRQGQDAAALAEKLGQDEAKVAEALEAVHEALREEHQSDDATTRPTQEERRAELATALAKELGIEEAKVTDALTALDTERNAARAAALQDRLDQAVTDGKLTRAEADAVKKAVEAGVIGGPGGGMGRGARR